MGIIKFLHYYIAVINTITMKGWKQMMMDSMVSRNACSDVLGRYFMVKERGKFIPYIQYKVGLPKDDCFLYFRKLPYPDEYIKKFIDKLSQLDQCKGIEFLSFHYQEYPNKEEFIDWVRMILTESITWIRGQLQRHTIAKVLIWAQLQTDLIQFDTCLMAEVMNLLQPTFSDPNDILEHEARQIAQLISSGVRERLTRTV